MAEEFKGLWMPAEVFTHPQLKDLSYAEKMLYCLINALSKKSGQCWASNTALAEMLGMLPTFVGNTITKLRKRDLIQWSKFKDRRLLMPSIPIETDPMGKSIPSTKRGGLLHKTWSPLITKHKKTNTLSRPSDRDKVIGDQEMAFFDHLEPKEATPPSKFDTACATKLKEALKTKNLITKPVHLKKWAHEFRILRKSIDKDTIKQVLTWYCEHVGEKYIPVALCAASFRDKFIKIKLRREHQDNKPEQKQHKKYDKATQSIYEDLKHYHWPKGTKNQLLDAIQDSVIVYDQFRKGLFDPKWNTGDLKIMRLVAELRLLVPGTSSFVRDWFENVNKSVQNWDAWSGNLRSMAVSLRHKKFQAIGRGWTDDYCGDPERWDKLMGMMQ